MHAIATCAVCPSRAGARIWLSRAARARHRAFPFFHRMPGVVDLTVGVVYGLVAHRGKSQGRRLGKWRALRAFPRARRVVGRSVRGSDDDPGTIPRAARRSHPSAEEPRPPSGPLDPFSLNPRVSTGWPLRDTLDATGRGWGGHGTERVRSLRCKGGVRERPSTSQKRDSAERKEEKWAMHCFV